MSSATQIDIFCYIAYDINNLLLLIELQPFLRKIPEGNGVANIKASAVWRNNSE